MVSRSASAVSVGDESCRGERRAQPDHHRRAVTTSNRPPRSESAPTATSGRNAAASASAIRHCHDARRHVRAHGVRTAALATTIESSVFRTRRRRHHAHRRQRVHVDVGRQRSASRRRRARCALDNCRRSKSGQRGVREFAALAAEAGCARIGATTTTPRATPVERDSRSLKRSAPERTRRLPACPSRARARPTARRGSITSRRSSASKRFASAERERDMASTGCRAPRTRSPTDSKSRV